MQELGFVLNLTASTLLHWCGNGSWILKVCPELAPLYKLVDVFEVKKQFSPSIVTIATGAYEAR